MENTSKILPTKKHCCRKARDWSLVNSGASFQRRRDTADCVHDDDKKDWPQEDETLLERPSRRSDAHYPESPPASALNSGVATLGYWPISFLKKTWVNTGHTPSRVWTALSRPRTKPVNLVRRLLFETPAAKGTL